MKTRKFTLVASIVSLLLILLGTFQYYLHSEPNVLIGNYFVAMGIVILCVVLFIKYIQTTKFVIKTPGLLPKVFLFLLPLIAGYLVMMLLLMILNILDMPDSYTMFQATGSISWMCFTSIGYWSSVAVFEAAILIMLIMKSHQK